MSARVWDFLVLNGEVALFRVSIAVMQVCYFGEGKLELLCLAPRDDGAGSVQSAYTMT